MEISNAIAIKILRLHQSNNCQDLTIVTSLLSNFDLYKKLFLKRVQDLFNAKKNY